MANVFIRDGGSGSGTSWSDALDDLPATLTRGDTYYIADGSYASYTFNDATSGTSVITIKKATESDHGTETGWSSAYGDGQAVFVGQLTFTTGYYTLNGQSKTSDDSGHGFKISISAGGDGIVVPSSNATLSNLEFYYIHIDGPGVDASSGDNPIYLQGNGHSNIIVDNCAFTRNQVAMLLLNVDTMTINQCYFGKNYRINPANHVEAMSCRWVDNVTIKYCKFVDIVGTGIIVCQDGPLQADTQNDGWVIFGNLFWHTAEQFASQDGPSQGSILGADTNAYMDNWTIYNNTFYSLWSPSNLGFVLRGTGHNSYNNLFYGCVSNDISISATKDYNWFGECYRVGVGNRDALYASRETNGTDGDSDPFVDSSNYDFRLNNTSNAIDAGVDFTTIVGGSEATDFAGNEWGSNGSSWDVGAYEYAEVSMGSLSIPIVMNYVRRRK